MKAKLTDGKNQKYKIYHRKMVKVKKVKKSIAVRELHLTATGNHILYGITQR